MAPQPRMAPACAQSGVHLLETGEADALQDFLEVRVAFLAEPAFVLAFLARLLVAVFFVDDFFTGMSTLPPRTERFSGRIPMPAATRDNVTGPSLADAFQAPVLWAPARLLRPLRRRGSSYWSLKVDDTGRWPTSRACLEQSSPAGATPAEKSSRYLVAFLADAFLPVFFPEDFLVDFLAFLVVFLAAIAAFPQPFN